MSTRRIYIASILSLLAGGIIGAVASRTHYLHHAQEQECKALSFAVMNSLPVISRLGSNDNAGAQHLVEINLPLQIESLREIAKGHGQSAQIAEETLRRVHAWRSEHATLAITPRLQKAIEPQSTPNLSLNSDPACIAFRSLSTSRFLGFVQRLGAGVAGQLLSLGLPMTNPYQLDPEAMKRKSALVQEEKLVTLRDDSTQPPPTIGTPSWMSILGGPALGQPSSRHTTFQHDKESFLFSARFWLVVGFVGFMLYIIKATLFR